MNASGIPVKRAFFRHTDKANAKRLLGIGPDKKHLVLMGGSMGCGPMGKIVEQLRRALRPDTEVSVICGNNRRLQRKLQRKFGSSGQIHVLGYIQDIPLYLDSADFYVTKPGGIGVTEAAVKQLPMAFVDAVAGCEAYNRNFFVDMGAAVTATTPVELAQESLCRLYAPEALAKMRAAYPDWPDAAGRIYRTLNEETACAKI